jgi:membrane protease YdiL (CAAX protease family)
VWYVLALAVPLAVTFVSIGLNTAFGAPVPDIAEFRVWYGLPMAIAINIVNPINAQLPEEASFRGWAQPKLQTTRTPLRATVLMAIGVTIWHIPLFVMGMFGSSPIEALTTIAVTFWYAWLFNHAAGSALLTLIAHAANGTIETSTLWQAGAPRRYPDRLAVQPGLVPGCDRTAGIRQKTLDQTASTGWRSEQSVSTCRHQEIPVDEVPTTDGPGAKPR